MARNKIFGRKLDLNEHNLPKGLSIGLVLALTSGEYEFRGYFEKAPGSGPELRP